jgi:hypothetical protein
MSIIKSGYRITVTSWENDGDNYATESKDGLTHDRVRYHCDLLQLISGSNCNDKTVFGNMYEPDDDEIELFREAVDKVIATHEIAGDDSFDSALDIINEYTGSGDQYTRVAEEIVVEFIPTRIDIEDVTKEFIQ